MKENNLKAMEVKAEAAVVTEAKALIASKAEVEAAIAAKAGETTRISDHDFCIVVKAVQVHGHEARKALCNAFRFAMNDVFFRKDCERLNALLKALDEKGASHFKAATIKAMFIFSKGFKLLANKQGFEREFSKELSCLGFDVSRNEYAIKSIVTKEQWQAYLEHYRSVQAIDFDLLIAKEPPKLLDIEQITKIMKRFADNPQLVKATQKQDVAKVLNLLNGVLPGLTVAVDAEQHCSMAKSGLDGKPMR